MYTYFREEFFSKVDSTELWSLLCSYSASAHPANCGSELSAGKGHLYFDHVPPSLLSSFPGYYSLVSTLGTTVLMGMASSTLRWPTVTLSFHIRGWRPAHFPTPDQVCFMPLGSSVTWSFTNSSVHRHGAVYENRSRIIKEMMGTQADQVCYSEIKELLLLLEAYHAPNRTLFQKPAVMSGLLTYSVLFICV